jgi:hypothetical protein
MNQNIKKLSQRMKEQRLKVASRIGKQVPLPKVRILPRDVERKGAVLAELIRKNGEELAAGVETVVDKVRWGGSWGRAARGGEGGGAAPWRRRCRRVLLLVEAGGGGGGLWMVGTVAACCGTRSLSLAHSPVAAALAPLRWQRQVLHGGCRRLLPCQLPKPKAHAGNTPAP